MTDEEIDKRAAKICGQLVEEGFDDVIVVLGHDDYRSCSSHASDATMAIASIQLAAQVMDSE